MTRQKYDIKDHDLIHERLKH